ncbi:hypothetical protein L494_2650 [Bordetella bronchiseptica CA90 BB1334]|nr:hypothetical protein L494_2650 [Bordetella bronchiseptica CA90 BB1334]
MGVTQAEAALLLGRSRALVGLDLLGTSFETSFHVSPRPSGISKK